MFYSKWTSEKDLKKYLTEVEIGFEMQKSGIQMLSEEFVPMEYPKSTDKPKRSYNKISLCFPKEMAYRVYDEFEGNEIEEMKNGDLMVSSEMPEDNWLIGYLLSFGTQVTVIEPTYLKKILSDEAKKIYEKNKA